MDGEKIISGTIGEVKLIKEGQTNKDGKIIPWSLFSVTIEGNQFRTFDRRFQTLVGQKGEWKYKEEQRTGADGSTYISKTLLSLPKPTGLSVEQGERIISLLQVINQKIDKINPLAQTLTKTLERFENEDKVVFYPKESKKEPQINEEEPPLEEIT